MPETAPPRSANLAVTDSVSDEKTDYDEIDNGTGDEGDEGDEGR